MRRISSAVAARIDAFIAEPRKQRRLRFEYRCPICDLVRYLKPHGPMCRICAAEFREVMARVREVME